MGLDEGVDVEGPAGGAAELLLVQQGHDEGREELDRAEADLGRVDVDVAALDVGRDAGLDGLDGGLKDAVDGAFAALLDAERDLLTGLSPQDQTELAGLLRRLLVPFAG